MNKIKIISWLGVIGGIAAGVAHITSGALETGFGLIAASLTGIGVSGS